MAALLTAMLLAGCDSHDRGPPPTTMSTVELAAPQPTSAPVPATHAAWLAYAREDGSVWLSRGDGTDEERLIEPGTCGSPFELKWSPPGDLLACRGALNPGPDERTVAVVMAAESGDITMRAERVIRMEWSSSGDYLALAVGPPPTSVTDVRELRVLDRAGRQVMTAPSTALIAWSRSGARIAFSPEPGSLRTYNVETGRTREFEVDAIGASGWALDDSLLMLASGFRTFEHGLSSWQTRAFDFASAQFSQLPPIPRDYWLTPDRRLAVFATGEYVRDEGFKLAFIDLGDGIVRVLEDTRISYPSDHIPLGNLRSTPDSKAVVWVTVVRGETAIYAKSLRSGAAERLYTVPGGASFAWFSPDARFFASVLVGPWRPFRPRLHSQTGRDGADRVPGSRPHTGLAG